MTLRFDSYQSQSAEMRKRQVYLNKMKRFISRKPSKWYKKSHQMITIHPKQEKPPNLATQNKINSCPHFFGHKLQLDWNIFFLSLN